MVANTFLSCLKQMHVLNRDKSENLIWFRGPTKNVFVKDDIVFHQESEFLANPAFFSYVCACRTWTFHKCTV